MKKLKLLRWHAAIGVVLMLAAGWSAASAAQPVGDRVAVDAIWTGVRDLPTDRPQGLVGIRPKKFRPFKLNLAQMSQVLTRVPAEQLVPLQAATNIVEIPMPDGSLARFGCVETPVMAPELAAKFPEIKTYSGHGVEDPLITVRFDITPAGFHAQIRSLHGTVYVDPAFSGEREFHISYYRRDAVRPVDGFACLVETDAGRLPRYAVPNAPTVRERSGGNLRTYRIAVAATAEYTAFHGGTVAGGLAAIVTAINRVTGVYESELAIRLMLVANNDLIIFTNPNSDPYSNGNPSLLLDQNQTTLDNVIGSANYDIGHVFSTAGGGLAALGVVCINGLKAQGETGTANPIGDPFYVDYVAHEIGHQFGANHTFNSTTGNCGGGNRNSSTAYERGSGSTIMSYAGICSGDNLQPNSDAYFHSASFDEILAYSTSGSGNGCAVISVTGNAPPVVSAGASYTIPQNTAFTLTAAGSDPDGDSVTYCWEERDLGPATAVDATDNGSSPLFRSWPPVASPSRTFPRLSNLLSNTLPLGEVMPTTTRTLNFRVTARDNRAGGGGVSTSDTQINVTAAAGPFRVTSHNSGGIFSGLQTVTWNPAGTAGTPVNTANVNILLSTNGGHSYPIILLAGTPNDGAQAIILPNLYTTTARLKVEAAGNVYFDVCNADFSIIPDVPTPLVIIEETELAAEECLANNMAIDPGETVTVNYALKNIGTADLTNLVATLAATNGVSPLGDSQVVGLLSAGGPAVVRPFRFTALGDCGKTFNTILQLQEGGAYFGEIGRAFAFGAQTVNQTAFSNAAALTVPDKGTAGAAQPFPSLISVSGVNGAVSKVTVTLRGFAHSWPADVDVLLVGPNGQKVVLMSDAGGGNAVSGLTLTFDDAAVATLSDVAAPVSGTFKPTNYGSGDVFDSPAPEEPYGAALAVFNGDNPNGDWSLYVQDDASQDSGQIALGWQLNIVTSNATCCGDSPGTSELALQQSVSAPVVNLGSNLTFSLLVSNAGPGMAAEVSVTNRLSAQLGFVSASGTFGSMSHLGEAQIFNFGALAVRQTAVVNVEAIALEAGAASNVAVTVCATFDPESSNNTAAVSVVVNDLPYISALPNLVTNEDSVVGPVLFTVGDREVPAVALTLSADSSDWDLLPPSNLVFGGIGSNRSLTISPGANMAGEAIVTVSVFDGLATVESAFTVNFKAVNDPPVISPLPNWFLVEGGDLVYSNVVTDPDLPPQIFWFELVNAPDGMTVQPDSGILTWTPDERFGGSTNLVSLVVTDDGVPSLSATQRFTVIVLETNSPPLLPVIPDFTLFEGESWAITNLATDPDLPANSLRFGLAVAPANAAMDMNTGVLAWTPVEEQGGIIHPIVVVVSDDGTPSLSATQSFNVIVLKTNSVPKLDPVGDFTISEGQLLTFTNRASDPDLPGDNLTFMLESAPPNAWIGPADGVFSWSPDEDQGDTTNLISVIVMDDGAPGLSATQSFTVIVLESNTPPALQPIDNQVIAEGETLFLSASVWDSDLPANALTYALHNAPANAVMDPDNGWVIWTPDESQGPSTNRFAIVVTDNGVPAMSATQSFTVVVLEVNDRPVLVPIADLSLMEGQTLAFTNSATDVDLPWNQLVFGLAEAPTNATIDPTGGVLTWTPAENQGPGTYIISVFVTDNGEPSLSATQTFTIVVMETNRPPLLVGIPDYKLHAGTALVFTNVATDPDVPTNALTFSLDAGAPAGATVGAADGQFLWAPGDADANTVKSISVRVTDDGQPPLSDVRTFLVTIVSRPEITGVYLTNETVSVVWNSLAGQRYRLQYKTGLDAATWVDVLPEQVAGGPTLSQTNGFDRFGTRLYRVLVVP